ncbi:hypothetical protein HK096_000493, partial [Nowakowskiella sp. JEL0078]
MHLLIFLLLGISAITINGASLVQITNFGTNPTHLHMFEYVPDTITYPRRLLLAVHFCTGSAQKMFDYNTIHTQADKYGFVVVYPETNRTGECWDVATSKALTRDGGSDPQGIISMVRNSIQRNRIDRSKVYVTGISSGAMMTNVLLAEYPDVFSGGSVFMGVPYTCFATESGGDPVGPQDAGWNNTCSSGAVTRTAKEWGNIVRNAYPRFRGLRPTVQLWHGALDTALNYHNFGEEIKMWTNVAGISQTPTFTDYPAANWTHTKYGRGQVEAHSFSNLGHELPVWGSGMIELMVSFFKLN